MDTGSVATILSKDIYDKIGACNYPLEDLNSALTVANGGLLNVYGKINVKFKVGNSIFPYEPIVAGLQGIDGIIGLDFLSAHDGVIETSKGRLRINGQNIEFD